MQAQKVLLLVLGGDSPKPTAPCAQQQWLESSSRAWRNPVKWVSLG